MAAYLRVRIIWETKQSIKLITKGDYGKKLFIGYFALGIFGSPEKDLGFVFLGGDRELYIRIVVLPLPLPLGVCIWTPLGSVLTLMSSFFKVWYWVPRGIILP